MTLLRLNTLTKLILFFLILFQIIVIFTFDILLQFFIQKRTARYLINLTVDLTICQIVDSCIFLIATALHLLRRPFLRLRANNVNHQRNYHGLYKRYKCYKISYGISLKVRKRITPLTHFSQYKRNKKKTEREN